MQSIFPEQFRQGYEQFRRIAAVVGRSLPEPAGVPHLRQVASR
jgi:hypothetical protein